MGEVTPMVNPSAVRWSGWGIGIRNTATVFRLPPQSRIFTRKTWGESNLRVRAGINLQIPSPCVPPKQSTPPKDKAVATKGAITHVIFDMDGLLLDTEKFYDIVLENILSKHGKTYDLSLKAKLMGMKAMEAAKTFVDESGLDGILTPEGFLEERGEMLGHLFPTSELMPGAKCLIAHLHANGIPICVATGTRREYFELKTQRHGEVFSLMHHVVTGDDPAVKKGKPAPDIFVAAANRFEENVSPDKILVFEDAPSGVAAAKDAGMSVVMVPDPRLDVSYHEGADQVLNSLLDFDPIKCGWGLPPFIPLSYVSSDLRSSSNP